MRNSLSQEKEIMRVLRQKPFFSRNFSLKQLPGRNDSYRYTIIISKKTIKLATSRNLVKRRIRAIIIKYSDLIKKRDFVVSVRPSALLVRGKELEKELLILFNKGGLLTRKPWIQ
ncbi:MAG: ribonuclease P protein component [Candidatus Komeilibacteria bacterium]|nr:ribonuclease P protein component [Candidatus Komeilibacteria bacterium]